MRLRRENAFWYVLLGLLALYLIGTTVMGGAGRAFGTLAGFVINIMGLILAVTVHECAHAWSANLLGDPTAKLAGRLTLNPLAHLDPLGTLMMVITALTGIGIGWGKPTPVRPYRLKFGSRLGNGIVAIAGPLSNIALAAVLGLLLRLIPTTAPLLRLVLDSFVLTNLFIAMFNLIPFPPLDGYSVLMALLSLSHSKWAWQVSEFLMRLEGQGALLLVGIIILTQFLRIPLLGWLVGSPALAMYRLIVG